MSTFRSTPLQGESTQKYLELLNQVIRKSENMRIRQAWVFNPDWHPGMLESWDTYELTGSGQFFKKALHGKIGK